MAKKHNFIFGGKNGLTGKEYELAKNAIRCEKTEE